MVRAATRTPRAVRDQTGAIVMACQDLDLSRDELGIRVGEEVGGRERGSLD